MLGAIIQARMGSVRLPGKVMKKVNGKNPMLYHLIQQINECKYIDNFVVATTTKKEDDIIENFLHEQNVLCFRGDEKDVLDRFYECAKKYSIDPIIRITADDPLIDPEIIDKVIIEYKNNTVDYVTNCKPRTFPYGTEVEIFSFRALETAWKNTIKDDEREHVTPFISKNPNKFKILNVSNSSNQTNFRWTVDNLEDFKLVEQIFLKIKKHPILIIDILNLFKNNPKLLEINKKYTEITKQ